MDRVRASQKPFNVCALGGNPLCDGAKLNKDQPLINSLQET